MMENFKLFLESMEVELVSEYTKFQVFIKKRNLLRVSYFLRFQNALQYLVKRNSLFEDT